MARAFDIEIVAADPDFPVKTLFGYIGGREATARALSKYVSLFSAEFTLYPPSLVRRVGVVRVVLCEGLTFAGQRRGAIPDWEHGTFYLDVSRGSYAEGYLRRVLHHEFFHFIDFRDDRSVYRDDAWASLNGPQGRYGNGGRSAQGTADASILTDKYPGFLDSYAKSGVEEDKAEVFACLLTESRYVAHRVETDAILRMKVDRMKQLLVEFEPALDKQFWLRVGERARYAPPATAPAVPGCRP